MPINPKYLADFAEQGLYHVYNRTNARELLFFNDKHRAHFLNRYSAIVAPFTDTFAYVLLPNHFHLLIRVKPLDDITLALTLKGEDCTVSETKFLSGSLQLGELMELTFKRLFQSYAQSFNKDVNRKGNLFTTPFKRVRIEEELHLLTTVIYIHANAVKHKIAKDFKTYKWSSWNAITGSIPSFVSVAETLELFGGLKNFVALHEKQAAKYYNYVSGMEG